MTFKTLSGLCGLALSTCVAIAQPSVCPIKGEKPMAVAQLFFGRSMEGRRPLTEAEWTGFATTELSRDFPDGFTVYDAQGQWRDSAGKIIREPSKVVIVAADEDAVFPRRVLMAAETYRKLFKQKSVGVITSTACAEF